MTKNNFKPFLLAAYGTLKTGFGNHRLINHCESLGECESAKEFTMYSINDWFPGVVKGKDSINLEIFKIEDKETANRLDRLEGYPNLYDKMTVDTPFGEATMYIYNRSVKGLEVVKSGNWEL